MLFREYGQTGKKVSLLGFGGMRFARIDDHDDCIRMIIAAAEGGVNYFDTAPGYFETRSETVFGKGFAELKRLGLPFYSATKTFASDGDGIRREIDEQLKRLNVPAIDFYHIWCIANLENWGERKKSGVLEAFRKLKEEGLIRHICVSSHLIKDEIKELLMEGVFEGVLFGYSMYNFQTRQPAFDAIREKKLGAAIMNPLGGGVIPQHPGKFGLLQRSGEGIVASALRFLWDHPEISTTVVGFQNIEQVRDALAAIKGYKPRTKAELEKAKKKLISVEGLCTGCGYCIACKADSGDGTESNCPQDVPIPQLMDAYNQKILGLSDKDMIGERLYWHWDLERSEAARCSECGECERACTQHLNIIERLKEIAQQTATAK